MKAKSKKDTKEKEKKEVDGTRRNKSKPSERTGKRDVTLPVSTVRRLLFTLCQVVFIV